ncbi:MAG: type II secretion system protein [Candidatus Gastranaerophilales bacterium]|nr:type II secretion system protein [Candidatus Gastranaerophilales bacterium]
MKEQKAFTLAEVLITLVIIGIIAALTIPSLLNKTNDEEKKVGVKKAYSVLHQAVMKFEADSGENLEDLTNKCSDDQCWYDEFYSKYFNIVSSMPPEQAKACHEIDDYSGTITFYTADGMAFSISNNYILIDVNGDRGPNTITHYANELNDGYVFELSYYNGNQIYPIRGAEAILTNIDCKKDPENYLCN